VEEDPQRLWNDPITFLARHMPPTTECFGDGLRVMYPNWCGIEDILGASLSYDPETIWVHPMEGGLDALDFSKVSLDSLPVKRLTELLKYCASEANGEWFMGLPPMGNAGDTIARMRSYGEYCMDIIDDPELVVRKEMELAEVWRMLYAHVTTTLEPFQQGTCGWLPAWYKSRSLLLEFDFCALISPAHFKLFIPAMEKRAELAERTIFHLDGPDALVHLDVILALPFIHAIQALPGAGIADPLEWMPVFKKIQSAGKSLYVGNSVSADEARVLINELNPEGLMLPVRFENQGAAIRFAEEFHVI
jgi:hypothetical protein